MEVAVTAYEIQCEKAEKDAEEEEEASGGGFIKEVEEEQDIKEVEEEQEDVATTPPKLQKRKCHTAMPQSPSPAKKGKSDMQSPEDFQPDDNTEDHDEATALDDTPAGARKHTLPSGNDDAPNDAATEIDQDGSDVSIPSADYQPRQARRSSPSQYAGAFQDDACDAVVDASLQYRRAVHVAIDKCILPIYMVDTFHHELLRVLNLIDNVNGSSLHPYCNKTLKAKTMTDTA